MVCRDWVPRSRSHQFKSLDFTKRPLRNGLLPFLDLLTSPHTTIGPRVRHITLEFYVELKEIPKSVFMRISALSALQSIALRGITYYDPTQADDITTVLVTVLGSLIKLSRLELTDIMFQSFIQLRAIVGACRELESLSLYSIRSQRGPQTLRYAYPESSPCPSLQVLRMIDCRFEKQVLEWVGACTPLRLRSLSIGFDTVVHRGTVLGCFLRALGSNLEELSIQRHDEPPDAESPEEYNGMECEKFILFMLFNSTNISAGISYEPINLRYNTRLEVLSLLGCSGPIIWINGLAIIDQVSSSSFRKLNITIDSIDCERRDNILDNHILQLTAIDTHLQRPNFANFEGLNIGLPMDARSMQEFFPQTAARDLLRVMCDAEMEKLPGMSIASF